MPETELTGEKIEIHVYQTGGDVDTLIGYTKGTVALEPTVDIIEAEVHDKKRKLRKAGKETVDLTFSTLVTTSLPGLAKMNLADASVPPVVSFSGAAVTKVVVKVFKLAADTVADQTITCEDCIPLLEGIRWEPNDFGEVLLRFIVNGAVKLGA